MGYSRPEMATESDFNHPIWGIVWAIFDGFRPNYDSFNVFLPFPEGRTEHSTHFGSSWQRAGATWAGATWSSPRKLRWAAGGKPIDAYWVSRQPGAPGHSESRESVEFEISNHMEPS